MAEIRKVYGARTVAALWLAGIQPFSRSQSGGKPWLYEATPVFCRAMDAYDALIDAAEDGDSPADLTNAAREVA